LSNLPIAFLYDQNLMYIEPPIINLSQNLNVLLNVSLKLLPPGSAIAGSAIAGSAIAGSAIAGSAIAGSAIAGSAIAGSVGCNIVYSNVQFINPAKNFFKDILQWLYT
jgi:hypothetical protein